MYKENWLERLVERMMDWFMPAFMLVIMVGAIGAAIYGIGYWIFADPPITQGTIEKVWMEPAHAETSTTYVKSGDVMIPITSTTHVPDTHYIIIRNGEATAQYEVSQAMATKLAVGDEYKR